jgi:hypothetical protein
MKDTEYIIDVQSYDYKEQKFYQFFVNEYLIHETTDTKLFEDLYSSDKERAGSAVKILIDMFNEN